MAVYDKGQIQTALTDGHIVCSPLQPNAVNSAYITLSVGYYYYRTERKNQRVIYNPFNREEVERYFDGPYKAAPQAQWALSNGVNSLAGLAKEHPVIAVAPGELVIIHSHEFIGVGEGIMMQSNTEDSLARNGISLINAGQIIVPNTINRLALIIQNLNHETILLPVGEPIVRQVFYGTTAESKIATSDLETSIRIWSPDMLLPQAYANSRTIPAAIEGLTYE